MPYYFLFYAIHLWLQASPLGFESTPCVSQPMGIQLQTSLSDEAFRPKIIQSDNRLEWCREDGLINIFTHTVEKFSFLAPLEYDHSQKNWSGKGVCSSGSAVDVELFLSEGQIDWVRIFYPEYRFLYIFAQDEEKLKQVIPLRLSEKIGRSGR